MKSKLVCKCCVWVTVIGKAIASICRNLFVVVKVRCNKKFEHSSKHLPAPRTADMLQLVCSIHRTTENQTSFFLWNGLSSGQSGMTSAKLGRLDLGFGTDKDYKSDNTEEEKRKKNLF